MIEPGAAGPAALAETHVSVVFFVGDRAYKLKKPVRFDFVDQSTPEARRALCEREVELNRRLAPDVYLGVADVVGPDGSVADHLVVMRRMPADRRLSTLVRAGDPRCHPAMGELGRLLAGFHRTAARGPAIDAAATRDAVRELWHANFAQLAAAPGAAVPAESVERVAALADAFLAGREQLFADRIAAGCIVDGHGDLLADDIYLLDDHPRVLDCLEFADRMRWGDQVADLAFLVMDLERLGAPEAATALVTAYEATAGPSPRPLFHHYLAYRAQVRSMVAGLRAAQEESGGPERAADQQRARDLLEQCRRHLERAEVRLVLVGGLPGTGKTTVARALAAGGAASVCRSDVVRKELVGLAPDQPAPAPFGDGIYTAALGDRTYAALLDQARPLLDRGHTVVLDASFLAERHRAAARRLAAEAHASVVELCCVVDPAEADRRIGERRREGGDASDADADIARRLASEADPWPECTLLPTDGPVAEVIARATRRMGPTVAGPVVGDPPGGRADQRDAR